MKAARLVSGMSINVGRPALIAAALLAILTISAAHPRSANAQLSKLAGGWAGFGSANYVLCYSSGYTSLVACDDAAEFTYFDSVSNFQFYQDSAGNNCEVATGVAGPWFGGTSAPTEYIVVGKSTSFSSNGTGTSLNTEYFAEPGVYCNGSVLVNNSHAQPIVTFTTSGVVSQGYSRVDAVITSIEGTPVNYIEDYVGGATAFKQ